MRIAPRRPLEVAIVALIIFNVLELGVSFRLRSTVQPNRPSEVFPKPSGYLSNGVFVRFPTAGCYVLRVSSDHCGFCRLDEVEYTELVQRARNSGCETVILAPKREQLESNRETSEVLQIQYIDFSFGRALVPYATPETIILSGSGRLVWFQEGAMNQDGLTQALSALGRTSD